MSHLTKSILLLTAVAVVSCTPSKTPAPAGGAAVVKEGEPVPPRLGLLEPVHLDAHPGAAVGAEERLAVIVLGLDHGVELRLDPGDGLAHVVQLLGHLVILGRHGDSLLKVYGECNALALQVFSSVDTH